MAMGTIDKCINIAWPAPHVYAYDSAGALCNQLLNPPWVNVVCRRIYIAKHRSDSQPAQPMCSRNKGKGREDNFTGKIKRLDSNFETNRCIAESDAMFDTDQLANAPLEFL